MNSAPLLVDLRQVRRNFQRAAPVYDAASFLAREINRRMLERLDVVRIDPGRILDLGCGTGGGFDALCERYPRARVLGADLSEPMLRAGHHQGTRWRRLLPFLRRKNASLLAADAVALPLASASMGLIWSNLMLHWLADPLVALREMHRVLEVDGLLMFSTLGPDTLKELRASFSDGHAHTQFFTDMHDYGDMLVECGYADPVMDVETLTLSYSSLDDLFRELRQSGSACAMSARRHTLTGRSAWLEACARYEQQRQEGRLPVSFEVVYGHAWKAPPRTSPDGRAIIRFNPGKRSQ